MRTTQIERIIHQCATYEEGQKEDRLLFMKLVKGCYCHSKEILNWDEVFFHTHSPYFSGSLCDIILNSIYYRNLECLAECCPADIFAVLMTIKDLRRKVSFWGDQLISCFDLAEILLAIEHAIMTINEHFRQEKNIEAKGGN